MNNLSGNISGQQTLSGDLKIQVAVSPKISVGTTTTINSDLDAAVELDATSTDLNPVFNFAIPKGDKGEKGDAGSVRFIVANELPTENINESAIYMIPAGETEGNTYAEYIYVNGAWESIGSASVNVDLTDYVKNTDYATKNTGGVVKINSANGVFITDGTLYLRSATNSEIANREGRSAITTTNLDYSVKTSLTDNKLEWTDDEKASARELLGVKDVEEGSGGTCNVKYFETTKNLNASENFVGDLQTKLQIALQGFINGEEPKPILIVKGPSTSPLVFVPGTVGYYNMEADYIDGGYYERKMNFSISNGNVGTVNFIYYQRPILFKNNTSSFTPTANYHPATKKYVDDAIASAIASLTNNN